MTGAGKTTTAKLLKEKLPRTAVLSMDAIKWSLSNFERGERDNAITRDVLFAMATVYIDHGISVIIDQPFKTVEEIERFEVLASENSIPCCKFQLKTEPEHALKRVMDRTAQKGGDLPQARVERNISLYTSRTSNGFYEIDTTNKEPREVLEIIENKM